MPFLGYAQTNASLAMQDDEEVFGQAPVSKELPSKILLNNLRDAKNDAVWAHAMSVPSKGYTYGRYYEIRENGTTNQVARYNNWYYSAAEYYSGNVVFEGYPVWAFAEDYVQGFSFINYDDGNINTNHTPITLNMCDITYDYHNSRMLGTKNGYIYEVNISAEEGELGAVIGTADGNDALYDPNEHDNLKPIAIACDIDGTLYFVSTSTDGTESSKLFKFEAADVDLEAPIEVGDLGWPARKIQTMAFDHKTRELFWFACDKDGNTQLKELDRETGAILFEGEMLNTEISGLIFEFDYRPYTAYCIDGELGSIRLKSGSSYTLTQNDCLPGNAVEFMVTPEEYYAIARVKVMKHGTDEELLSIEAEDIADDLGSFLMFGCDVDIIGEWIGGEHGITYQWTPENVAGLEVAGPDVANYKNYVTFNYATSVSGYILTDLAVQSGSTSLTVTPLTPDQAGMRQFMMPADDVVVTGTWLEIELEQLADVCQNHAPGIPSFEPSAGITSAELQVKKPGTDSWVALADNEWIEGAYFDLTGTWQYRVEIINEYDTFHSISKTFQVYEAPLSIAIEGDAAICEGGNLSLSVITIPENTNMNGSFQWYKDGTPLSKYTRFQLTIENVTADDAGSYSAVYTVMGSPTNANPNGELLCQFEAEAYDVTVNPLPEITWMQPSADTAVSLVTASLELQATPEGGTFYYLKQGNEERTEITGNTFTFPEVGEYELVYSYVDEYGCASEASVNAEVKQHHFIYYQENGNTNFPDNYTITGASEFTDGETTLLYAHQDDEVTVTVEVPDCNHLTGISIFTQGDDGSPFCILDWVNPSTNTFTITMPAQNGDGIPYYVTVNATWAPNEHNITYQYTPSGITGLNITGPAFGNCGSEVTVSYKTNIYGYILTQLTAKCGNDNIDLFPLSPNQDGKRQFTMPDGAVTVIGTYQAIELELLPNVCQYQAPGVPAFNITSSNYTSYLFSVKKPGNNSGWTTINDNSYWENGNNFDVAGSWQYRVEITNGYGTFRSNARDFQVYEAPQSIAIDGETAICEGGDLVLTVVPTPDDAVMNGQFQWYKDGNLLPNNTRSSLAIDNVIADNAGSYSATFMVGDDLCQFETEAFAVNVNPLPEVAWVQPSNDTNDTIVLSVMTETLQLEATPAGGSFTYTTADAPETPITIEGGLLNPSEMGVGTYQLTYSYTDTTTHCTAEASIDVKITKRYWTDIEIRDNDWFNNCFVDGVAHYEITNARELGAFAALLSYNVLDPKDQEGINFYTFDNDTVWISSDIDLLEEPYYFRPLNEFCGTLNGLGHVIGNMVIDEKNLIMVFNQYSRIDNIGFLNAKITNESETKVAIDIKGTMYNSYFSNPELNNIEFNFNPTGDVQNVYYYNERGEETISKYICREQVDLATVDVTPAELLTGEGQNEGTGYLADWVWLQNKNDYYSWMQDPVGDETGNYGYPVMDTSFMHHHYVYILSDYNNGCKLGGKIKNRIIGDDEYVYAMNDDTITLEFTEYFHGIIDTVMIVARNYSVEGYDLPIEYSEEDGIITFVMPADNLYDEAYDVLINVVSHKDYWTDSPNYDATWFSNGRNPSSGVWEIRSNEQLAAFAKTVLDNEYDFEEEVVWINGAFGPGDEFQKGRLNMVAHLWKPIDGFRGILDGGGFIIDSLDIRENTSYMMGQMGAEAIVCNLGIQDLMIPDSSYVFNNKAGEGHVYNSYITKNTDTDNSIYYIACEGAHVENTYILNPEMVDFNGDAINLDDLNTWVDNNKIDETKFMVWCGDDINFNYGYPFHYDIAGIITDHIVHFNPGTGGEIFTPNDQTLFYMHDIVNITCNANSCMHLVSITVRKTNDGSMIVPCWTTPEGNYCFDMPPYDVDVDAEWAQNLYPISYQWTPSGVNGLNISGPSIVYCGSNVTVNYTYNTEGYILTGLTAQSGNDNIDVIPLSPNQDGKRWFTIPEGSVTVTGTYQEITLEQLDDICLNSPSQAPSYSFPEGVTDNGLYVKKPGSDDWTVFAANDWTDGDIFDMVGIWQYRAEVSNEYGTFHSATLEFQVLDDSSIAIEGDSDYCEGNTLELSAVPTSANAVLNGQFQWYKDGTLIPDATQSQLLIENVNPDHAGDYSATYTVGENLCSIETEAFAVNVHPLPEVAWVQPSNDTNDTIELSMVQEVYQLEATPAGGTFTYTTADTPETVHTVQDGVLHPFQMGAGSYTLTYSYTDTTTHCIAEASIDVKITKSYWTDDGNYNEDWFDDCINDGRRFEIAGSRDLAAFARKIMADHYGEEPYYFWNEQLNVPDTVFIVGSTYVEEGDYQIEDLTGFLNMENYLWMPVTGFRGVLNGTHFFIDNLKIAEELSAMFIDMSGDVLNLGIQDINMPDGSAVFATTSDDVTTGTVYNSHFTNATGHRNFTIDDGNYTLVNNYLVDSLNNQTDGRGNNVDIASLNTWGMTQPLDFLQHLYGWVTDSSTESEQINYGYDYHANIHILPGFAITYHPDQTDPENACYINGDSIAQEGTDVKVSICPATGYYCSMLVVVDQNDNATSLQQQNNEAHFTMPNGPVDVYATFALIEWPFTLYFMIEGTTNSVHNPYTTTYHYQDEISIVAPTITGLVPLTDPYTNTMPNAALTDTVFYSGDEFEVIFCDDIETMSCVNSYGTSHTNNIFQALSQATVNVELEDGCSFNVNIVNLTNGEVIYNGDGNSITFEMPMSDVHVCIDITSKAFLGINNNSLNVSLYPNPTSDEVKILCDEVKIDRVTVYDILGQIVLDNEVNGNETVLHLKDAAVGMYLVRITTEQGYSMKKLIVE